MIRSWKWWYAIVLNLVLATLVVSGAVLFRVTKDTRPGAAYRLEIRDASSKLYGRWTLGEGDEFAVEFIHPVSQSLVRETFQARKRRIWPIRFTSFDANIPPPWGEGEETGWDGEALVMSGFNRSFRELTYHVGTASKHLLRINGEIVDLRERCGKDGLIRIRLS